MESVMSLKIMTSDIITDSTQVKQCKWVKAFDGHFNISCANESGQRAHGSFKYGKWNFVFCPYCGKIDAKES